MIYQVTVHGRKLESRDLKKLLARAVAEKRNMDFKRRFCAAGQGAFARKIAGGGVMPSTAIQ